MGRVCSRTKEGRRTLKILTVKPIGKRLLRRSRRRWEDNIRMYFKQIGFSTRNWIDSARVNVYWRALVNTALDL